MRTWHPVFSSGSCLNTVQRATAKPSNPQWAAFTMSIWCIVGPDISSRSSGQHATRRPRPPWPPAGNRATSHAGAPAKVVRRIRNEPPSARMRPAESSSCGNQPPPLTGAWSVTLPLRRGRLSLRLRIRGITRWAESDSSRVLLTGFNGNGQPVLSGCHRACRVVSERARQVRRPVEVKRHRPVAARFGD